MFLHLCFILFTGEVSFQGGLFPGVSVQGPGGSLSWGAVQGDLCQWGVSVQGGGLCPGRGSLSREGVSVQGVSVQGASAQVVSVLGVFCQGDPRSVKSRRYAFYLNAFLFFNFIFVPKIFIYHFKFDH